MAYQNQSTTVIALYSWTAEEICRQFSNHFGIYFIGLSCMSSSVDMDFLLFCMSSSVGEDFQNEFAIFLNNTKNFCLMFTFYTAAAPASANCWSGVILVSQKQKS